MENKYQKHIRSHLVLRSNWLRAAVLGANDGILSTASIISGMVAAGATHANIVLAGLAGLVAGAASMATGEYVSVSSQSDIEKADLEREAHELKVNPEYENDELTQIYIDRGLEPDLARVVATQLMNFDALKAHARDEMGISEVITVNPLQAAVSSALSFSGGALLPLVTVMLFPVNEWIVFVVALLALITLGIVSAKISGSSIFKPTIRVIIWGILSMSVTALAGKLTGSFYDYSKPLAQIVL